MKVKIGDLVADAAGEYSTAIDADIGLVVSLEEQVLKHGGDSIQWSYPIITWNLRSGNQLTIPHYEVNNLEVISESR
jgi:hypothetical protein